MAEYQSKYTGEQIDEAVGKALEGGDTQLYKHTLGIKIGNSTESHVFICDVADALTTPANLKKYVSSPIYFNTRVKYNDVFYYNLMVIFMWGYNNPCIIHATSEESAPTVFLANASFVTITDTVAAL